MRSLGQVKFALGGTRRRHLVPRRLAFLSVYVDESCRMQTRRFNRVALGRRIQIGGTAATCTA
jgi:hypothetical protein